MQDANLNSGTPFFKIRIFKYTKSKLFSYLNPQLHIVLLTLLYFKMESMPLPDSSVTLIL